MPTPPGVIVPPAGRDIELPEMVPPTIAMAKLPCPDPDPARRDPRRPEDCPDPQQTRVGQIDQRGLGTQAPITPGRQFADEPAWNFWFAVGPHSETNDRRYGLDKTMSSNYATFGVDRKISNRLVAGGSVNLEKNSTDSFGTLYGVSAKGITFGPHLGFRFSDAWTMDVSASMAVHENTTRLVELTGSYGSTRYTGATNVTGNYLLGDTGLRPRVSASYTYSPTDAYELSGQFNGALLTLPYDAAIAKYGDITPAIEINHPIGRVLIPYLDLSVRYDYLRANGGQIMTGDLTLATPPPWTGMTRAGLRTLLGGTTFLEIGAGYVSFFQRGLDAWEFKVFLSQGF